MAREVRDGGQAAPSAPPGVHWLSQEGQLVVSVQTKGEAESAPESCQALQRWRLQNYQLK